MTYGWLGLPLLAGYWIVNHTDWFRSYHQYLDRQRLVFHASTAGVALLAVAFAITELTHLVITSLRLGFDAYLLRCELPHLAVPAMGSVVLGALAFTVDRFRSSTKRKAKYLRRAIERVGTPLDKLLFDALEQRTTLLFTLDNAKCYVGYAKSTPEPRQTKVLSILPILSGYRDAEQRLELTTSYAALADQVTDGETELVIDLEDVTSIARWDLPSYLTNYAEGREG